MELNYLSRDDAEKIITDTNYNHESKAIQMILDITSNNEKTANHPGYVQIICFELSRIYGHFVSSQNVEDWTNDYLHKLPEHYFSNLWGFSMGLEKSDLSRCLAVLFTISSSMQQRELVSEEDILASQLSKYLSRSEILVALNQLTSIRSINRTAESNNKFYSVKMPLVLKWLNKNFSLDEIFLDLSNSNKTNN